MTLKSLVFAFPLLALSFQAQAARMVWDCRSSADPDYANATVFQEGSKTYLTISEYYGDGDSYAHDAIEVAQIAPNNADWVTYVQIPDRYPASPLGEETTKQSQGVTLRISLTSSGETALVGLHGPSGNELNEVWLECRKK